MATQCPRCHEFVEEDYVCCAGIEFQWTCSDCHKRSRGFAIPFGQCPLCGGKLERVEIDEHPSRKSIIAVQEAIQIEVNAYHFYRHLAETVEDEQSRDFFESMAQMEKEHSEELSQKYHVDLGSDIFEESEKPMPEPFFKDLGFVAGADNLEHLYDCAIILEKKAHDFFLKKAETFPESREHDLYLELAAEESEHVSLLETERDRLIST